MYEMKTFMPTKLKRTTFPPNCVSHVCLHSNVDGDKIP